MADKERKPAGRRAAAFQQMRKDYAAVLLKYVGDPGHPRLLEAQRLGAKAMEQGVGLAELTKLHHETLCAFLKRGTPEGSMDLALQAAGDFLAASMEPYARQLRKCEDCSAALRYMNRRLEDQAVRAAHALYNEPLQLVAATYLGLNDISPLDRSGTMRDLSGVTSCLNELEAQLSALSQELHPCVLDDLGMDASANWLGDYFRKVAGADIEVESSLRIPLSAGMARVLYRAVQEVLTNIAAYAAPKKVHIRMQREGNSIACAIRDDGHGFDASGGLVACGDRGLWLLGIGEGVRAYGGDMTVNSSPDNGTELIIAIPVDS